MRVLQSQNSGQDEHGRQDENSNNDDYGSDDDSEGSDSVDGIDDTADSSDLENAQGNGNTGAESAVSDTMKDARRLFPWHGEQKCLAEKLLQLLQAPYSDEEAKVEALLRLSESFIFVTVRGNVFISALLHFLAVLGIDEDSGRLREANDFSYLLAGVVYCVRAISIEAILPSAEREQQDEEDDKRFIDIRERYLADGGYSPMSKMISLLAYGKMIARNHGNAGSVLWSQDKKVIQLRGRKIPVSRFKNMVAAVIEKAENLFWSQLMWSNGEADRFEMPLDKLEDDPTWTKRGVSFLDNSTNGLQDKRAFMLARAEKHRNGRKLRSRERVWQLRKVRRWLRFVDEFRELLLFCVHITGGQPARGTEITSVRYKNGFMQDRNVYIIHGQVAVITRYHKSQSQQDKPKIVPRFLPYRVAQLMVLYLAYVRPLQEYLSVISRGHGWSEYIWGGQNGVWETDRLTKIIGRETQALLKVKLNTHDYRHLAIGIGRVVVGDQFAQGYQEETGEVEEEEVETDDPLEMSAGRGGEVGSNRYGVPVDIIKHLSNRSINIFRPLSEKWHDFLGLNSYSSDKGQKHAREENAVFLDGRSSRGNGSKNHISGWSAGLSRLRTATDQLQLQQQQQPLGSTRSGSSSQWYFGQVSQSIQHPPAGQRLAVSEDALTSHGTRAASNQQSPLLENQISTAMRKALRLAAEDDVSYRSEEQREAMQVILQDSQSTPLVVILPTGGGKSLLFTTPACLEDAGVTVVVVPFRALINNLVDTAKKSGIDSAEWHHGLADPVTLLFVSANKITGSGFLSYAQLLKQKGLLRRVFVDECHLTFTASDWREKLLAVRSVRGLQVPLIMLTATLPPMLAFELEAVMACQAVTRYIRATTTRPRTRYIVDLCKRGKLEETTLGVCSRMQKHIGRQKGVVYCRSIDQCKDMAKELGCSYYHGGSVDNEEKLATWLQLGGLIVATSALGTGVDFPGIVFILHMDLPYGMIDFAQESGRAGRGGENVDSIVIVEQGKVESMRQSGRLQGLDNDIMAEFVTSSHECRRAIMSRYLDGRSIECGSGDMAQCDRCGEGLTALERLHEKAGIERQLVERTLSDLADGCASCWMWALVQKRGDEDSNDKWTHASKDCQARELNSSGLELSEGDCDRLRGMVRFEKSSRSCHKCWISQRLCATRHDEKRSCQWSNVVVPLLRAVMTMQGGMTLLQRVGYDGEHGDWQAYARWLGSRHPRRIWDELVSNVMATVIELIVSASANIDRQNSESEEGDDEDEGQEQEHDNKDDEDCEKESEEQSAEQRQIQSRLQARLLEFEKTDGRRKLRELADKLRDWAGCCVICKASTGERESEHEWRTCTVFRSGLDSYKNWMYRLEGLRPDRHSGEKNGCWGCCVPVQICKGWSLRSVEHDGRSWRSIEYNGRGSPGRFRWVRSFDGWSEGECQWEGLAVEVAITLLFLGPDEVRAWIDGEERLQKRRRRKVYEQGREEEDEGLEESEENLVEAVGEFLLEREVWDERGELVANVVSRMIWLFG